MAYLNLLAPERATSIPELALISGSYSSKWKSQSCYLLLMSTLPPPITPTLLAGRSWPFLAIQLYGNDRKAYD